MKEIGFEFVCPRCVGTLLLHIRALWEMACAWFSALLTGDMFAAMAHGANFTTLWTVLGPALGRQAYV